MRLTFITLLTLISAIFNFTYSQIKDAQVNLFAIPTLSTSFVRMSSRNASQEIDAVYYNPAGVMSLSNGFHLNVTNQFTWINQNLSVNKYKTNSRCTTQKLSIYRKKLCLPHLYGGI